MKDTLFLLPKGSAIFVPGGPISEEAVANIADHLNAYLRGDTKVLVLKQECDVRDWRATLPIYTLDVGPVQPNVDPGPIGPDS